MDSWFIHDVIQVYRLLFGIHVAFFQFWVPGDGGPPYNGSAPKGQTDEFYGFIKSGKRRYIFVIDSYLNENALAAIHKGMQSSYQGVWKGYHLTKKLYERVTFFEINGV